MRVSAILLSWQRRANIPRIVASLRAIEHIDEILIWNNDPDAPLVVDGALVFNSPRNYKCPARYCLVPLAQHDHIWFQDDDLILTPAQFERILGHYRNDCQRIYGCRGRKLDDECYNGTDAYGRVDVVLGQAMLFHRSLLHHWMRGVGRIDMTEDDIMFSVASPMRPFAVDVGPIEDLGSTDGVALSTQPGHFERRQHAVNAALRFFQ